MASSLREEPRRAISASTISVKRASTLPCTHRALTVQSEVFGSLKSIDTIEGVPRCNLREGAGGEPIPVTQCEEISHTVVGTTGILKSGVIDRKSTRLNSSHLGI